MMDMIRLLLFPALLAFAASSDLFTMTISNKVSLALAGGFLVMWLPRGMGGKPPKKKMPCGLHNGPPGTNTPIGNVFASAYDRLSPSGNAERRFQMPPIQCRNHIEVIWARPLELLYLAGHHVDIHAPPSSFFNRRVTNGLDGNAPAST